MMLSAESNRSEMLAAIVPPPLAEEKSTCILRIVRNLDYTLCLLLPYILSINMFLTILNSDGFKDGCHDVIEKTGAPYTSIQLLSLLFLFPIVCYSTCLFAMDKGRQYFSAGIRELISITNQNDRFYPSLKTSVGTLLQLASITSCYFTFLVGRTILFTLGYTLCLNMGPTPWPLPLSNDSIANTSRWTSFACLTTYSATILGLGLFGICTHQPRRPLPIAEAKPDSPGP